MAITVLPGTSIRSGSIPTLALSGGVVSSSLQVTTLLPSGVVSSSTQFTTLTAPFTGSFTGSFTGLATSASYVSPLGLPTGTVSASSQLPTGTVSSSAQVQLGSISGVTFSNAAFQFPSNVSVEGTLTARELHTKYVSASIIYESGSSKFGDTSDDKMSVTGSIGVLGTLTTTGAATLGSTLAVTGVTTHSAKIIVENSDQSEARLRVRNTTANRNWDIIAGRDGANNTDFQIKEMVGNTIVMNALSTGAVEFPNIGVTVGGGLTVSGATTLNAGLAVTSASAGATTATLTGLYSASSSVSLLTFQRTGGAVAGSITYDDSVTSIWIGTTTAHTFKLRTNNIDALTITSGQAATFSGTLTVSGATTLTGLTVYGTATAYTSYTRADTGLSGRVGAAATIIGGGSNTDYLGLDGESGIQFGIAGSPIASFNSSGALTVGGEVTLGVASATPLTINGQTSGASYVRFINTSGVIIAGTDGSTPVISGGNSYEGFVGTNTARSFNILYNGSVRATINSGGMAVTGTLTVSGATTLTGLTVYGVAPYSMGFTSYTRDDTGLSGRVGPAATLIGGGSNTDYLGLDGESGIQFGIAGSAIASFNSSGALSIGTNPSGYGTIRLPNNSWIAGRTASNDGNISIIAISSANKVSIDPDAVGTVMGSTLTVGGMISSTITSGAVVAANTATTSAKYYQLLSTGGDAIFAIDNSSGTLAAGSSAYACVIGTGNATPLALQTSNIVRCTINSAGRTTFVTSAYNWVLIDSTTSDAYLELGYAGTPKWYFRNNLSNSHQLEITPDAGTSTGLFLTQGGALTVKGTVAAANGGVDGTYAAAFISYYTANYVESNAIMTSVSTTASNSGFRFDVSNGAGSASRTTALTLTRSGATFSGTLAVSGLITSTMGNNTLIFNSVTATTGYQYANISNTSGALAWGVENSTGGGIMTGSSAYAGFIAAGGVSILTFGTNGVARQTISAAGAVRFHAYGAGTATFDSSGNITSVSDELHKTDIAPFTAGLTELLGITPITHKYNELSGLEREHTYIGFSAQNVQQHIPGAVFERADGILTLWDRGLLAAAINAIRTLEARVAELESAG